MSSCDAATDPGPIATADDDGADGDGDDEKKDEDSAFVFVLRCAWMLERSVGMNAGVPSRSRWEFMVKQRSLNQFS